MGNARLMLPNSIYPFKVACEGVATAAGAAAGTTLVSAMLTAYPSQAGKLIQILSGQAIYCERVIATHAAGGNTITVTDPFTDNAGAAVQIPAGTWFAIKELWGGGVAPGPPPPSVGLWMFGVCNAGMMASATNLYCANLAGLPDDIFNDEFWCQVIHNDDNPGGAPEREIRRIANYVSADGHITTDAFTGNVEEHDIICVFHESILPAEILGFGTLDTSSATVPADSTRTEGDNYFNGCLLMPTEGACRFQPRRIVDYTGVGGIFTLDPNNPFTAASGLVDYVIIGSQTEFIPAVDGTNNRTPSDVIGGKADTALYAIAANASLVRYLKAVHGVKIVATGTADAGSDFDTLIDAARTEANNYWDGLTLLMVTGNNAGLSRPITEYMLGVGIDVRPAFPNAIAAGNVYVILSAYHDQVYLSNRQLFCMDFWSDPQEEVSLAAAAATKTLPTVTVADLPSGATIVRAIAMFKFRMVENTNAAANKLNGATVAGTSQVIQVRDDTPGTWYDAINFVDDQFGIAATTREGGDVCIGSVDIAGAGKVDANDGYNFQWLLGRADLDNLNFNDVQVGLRIWYSV